LEFEVLGCCIGAHMMGSVEEKIRAGGLIRVRCQPATEDSSDPNMPETFTLAGDCFESLEEDVSNGVKFACLFLSFVYK
jgi:hypothetical protein